jgi:3-oxoacyl-[acyl-carrier protein] reductase
MLLKNQVAVIHGGGGVIGGAVARAFAREGAAVHLAGRTEAKLRAVAQDIRAAGGQAEFACLDALDLDATARHAAAVAGQAGGIDIALNAIGIAHVQGRPLDELSLEDYALPVQTYLRSNFITAKAVAPHMRARRAGVILMLTTPASRMAGPGYLGHAVACAGVEGLTRHLAGELGGFGVRVLCIRSHAIPQAVELGSHSAGVFAEVARREATSVGAMLDGAAQATLLRRLPLLEQVAATAVFLASGQAGAMTGTVANLTCGMVLD